MYHNATSPHGYHIIHSTVVFKHGLRAPIDKIPGNEIPWNCTGGEWLYPGGSGLSDEVRFKSQFIIKQIERQSFLKGNCKAGELLNEGIEQMKDLGKHLARTYRVLVDESKKYGNNIFSFRSTYNNRCLASMQIVAQQLLKNDKQIDVFVANEELESLVPNSYSCPKLGILYNQTFEKNSSFYNDKMKYEKHLDEIKNISGITVVPHWSRIGEYLVTRKCAHINLPGKFNESFMNESVNLLVNFYKNVMKLEKGKSFASGLLLSEIYLGMRDFLAGSSRSKINLICGHTLTLVSILSSLNLTVKYKPYGSYIAFELYEKDDKANKFIVRVLVDGKLMITIDFDEFKKKVMNLRPSEEECQIRYPYLEKDKKDPGIKLLQFAFS